MLQLPELDGVTVGTRNRIASVNEPKSTENGNIRGSSRRLFPKQPANSPIWEFRDRPRIAKARQQRAVLSFEEYCLGPPDCLAGDAVLIAPVSRRIPCYQGI